VAIALAIIAGCEPSAGERAERAERAERNRNASAEVAALGGEVAARVGDARIPLTVVARVAEAERVAPRLAAERVVDDEVAAEAARARGLDRRLPAAWLARTAAARMAIDRITEEARRRGPPTDDEVTALSERHWALVDRPPAVRTIHAVVLWPKDVDTNPASKQGVRALAGALRAAVVGASDADFESRAKAAIAEKNVAHLETRIERLPGITEDGRVVEGGGAMDAVFSKAASGLSKPGETSGVVETQFGAHVIRLLERLPEKRMPLEERRLAFAPEVQAQRARASLEALLERLKREHPVAVSSAAETLMRDAATAAARAIEPAPEDSP
jgi:hypothetical protein